jgi:hypothetical protein
MWRTSVLVNVPLLWPIHNNGQLEILGTLNFVPAACTSADVQTYSPMNFSCWAINEVRICIEFQS